jgi:hypothetical protein
MATPSEKLAASLELLHKLQSANSAAIGARDMPRTHMQRQGQWVSARGDEGLVRSPGRPDEKEGDSTAWYASFWRFAALYLKTRFGKNWSLSSEQSLSLHGGNWTVPSQLFVRSSKGGNKIVPLPHGTSWLDVRASLPSPPDREEKQGLRIFSLESGLIESSPQSAVATVPAKRATLTRDLQ